MRCLSPKTVVNPKTGKKMPVACRKCLPCRKYRAHDWTVRLIEHEKTAKNNWFVTLTLSDDNLTWGYDKPTLVKRDVQLFMMRLRKLFDCKLKYYAVGEYGENTKRPHYHLILFNTNCDDKKAIELIVWQAWKNGLVHVGEVTPASIRYVAGYLEKGIYGENNDETIIREFNLQSLKLGSNYVEKNKNYHEETKRYFYVKEGKKTALPRYYKQHCFSDEAKVQIASTIDLSLDQQKPTRNEALNDLKFRLDRINALNNLKNKRK
ncbi:MAG: replication initiator protein [Microviridae sp.]|nr:MAG: replication initiator protein [Microviridae sp.]